MATRVALITRDADGDQVIQLVGGFYVGCRVRVGEGSWETAACKNPAVNALAVGENQYTWVCDEHLHFIQSRRRLGARFGLS